MARAEKVAGRAENSIFVGIPRVKNSKDLYTEQGPESDMKVTIKQQRTKPADLKFKILRYVAVLLLAMLASACATTQPVKTDIKQRAQARWDALMAGDYDTAYGFYSPGYRSSHSRVDFEIAMRVRRIEWTTAEVRESSCEADVCTVSTRIGYRVKRAVPGVPVWNSKRDIKEKWVRTQDTWWFLPED